MIGTLRLTTQFIRFGFNVPRGGGAESYVDVGQLHRSDIKAPSDGPSLAYQPTTTGEGGKGVKDVTIAK